MVMVMAPAAALWTEHDIQRRVRAYGGLQETCSRIPVTSTPQDYLNMFKDDTESGAMLVMKL